MHILELVSTSKLLYYFLTHPSDEVIRARVGEFRILLFYAMLLERIAVYFIYCIQSSFFTSNQS